MHSDSPIKPIIDMNQVGTKVCRICFDDETQEKPLISPCLCKGSSKYIHEECLTIWLITQPFTDGQKVCEVCKYKFKIEVKKTVKCDPREGLFENPQYLCYISILLLVTAILFILLVVVITKDYIDPEQSIAYFLGVIAIFFFSLLCSISITFKLFKMLCCVVSEESLKIHPVKEEDESLNTTKILHSIPRLDSVIHDNHANLSDYLERERVLDQNK